MGLLKKKAAGTPVEGGGPSDEVKKLDAPWVMAGRAHDNTYLQLATQVRNWQKISLVLVGIAGLSVAGNVYIGSQSKYIPMLVEVDKLGRTLAVGAVNGSQAITDSKRLGYREMFELIEHLRTVTTDYGANNANIHKGFVRLKGAARAYALAELRKAPPNEAGATKTVQIEVRSALPISDKTWQVEWVEHTYSLQGAEVKVESWKATLRFDFVPAGNEEDIRENPTGFTVTDLNWMKVI